MKKNYPLIAVCALLIGNISYGQAPKFYLDFEGVSPLSSLPSGVTNVDGTNTIRVKNTTDYPAIPNEVQSDGAGGNELFLDFQGYLKLDVPDPSYGFSLAYDYKRNNVNDDWWLGFLTFIGVEGADNKLEQIQIREWSGQLNFGGENSIDPYPIWFDTDYKIVITCSPIGDINLYVDNVLKLSVPNATSGKNIHTWTNASLLLSFKGSSFDGTNVTPEGDFASNARDARAFVDNVALYEDELSAADVAQLFTNGNNSLSVKEQKTNSLNIYPNSVRDVLNFSSPDVKSVAIYSVLGSKVMTKEIKNSSVEVSDLKAGVYFVNCFDVDGKRIDGIKMIKL